MYAHSFLTQVLQSTQKENFDLRNELKKLKLDLNSLQLGQQKKKGRQSDPVPDAVASQDSEIAKYGRKYSLMVCPWIDPIVFHGMDGRPDCDPTSPSRYANEESALEATRAEVYDFIPTKLHAIMGQHSHFLTVVRHLLSILLLLTRASF